MKKFILKNWVILFSVICLIVAVPSLFIHGILSLQMWQFTLIVTSILMAIKFCLDSIAIKKQKKEAVLNEQKEIEKKQKADEERRKAAEEKKALEEKKQVRFYQIFVSLANDVPISAENLIYLAKNVSFPNEFPIAKLVKFDFLELISVSTLKKKIIWHNDLESILKMYNSFFKYGYVDSDLKLIVGVVMRIYFLLDKFKNYESLKTFKKMVIDSTPNLSSFWQEENLALFFEEEKIR
jgi:hypothetical protein